MLEINREDPSTTAQRYEFRSPRKEPPISPDDYLEGPPPSPSRPEDDK